MSTAGASLPWPLTWLWCSAFSAQSLETHFVLFAGPTHRGDFAVIVRNRKALFKMLALGIPSFGRNFLQETWRVINHVISPKYFWARAFWRCSFAVIGDFAFEPHTQLLKHGFNSDNWSNVMLRRVVRLKGSQFFG